MEFVTKITKNLCIRLNCFSIKLSIQHQSLVTAGPKYLRTSESASLKISCNPRRNWEPGHLSEHSLAVSWLGYRYKHQPHYLKSSLSKCFCSFKLWSLIQIPTQFITLYGDGFHVQVDDYRRTDTFGRKCCGSQESRGSLWGDDITQKSWIILWFAQENWSYALDLLEMLNEMRFPCRML